VVICSTGFDGVPGGESGDAPLDVRAKLQALHQELNSGVGSLEILDLTGRVIATATATATVDAPSMR